MKCDPWFNQSTIPRSVLYANNFRPEKTAEQLELEEILKDTEMEQDKATYKARDWDNWKDDNEKGIGKRGL